jgi:excisionase family DNA binding protein
MKDVADVYLTPEQIAERLQLGVEKVYQWLRSRKLRGSQTSPKAWRVSERELAAFLKRQNVSELLFEEYVDQYELGTFEREPPYLGTTKRVDYRLTNHNRILWFEVKEFADDQSLSGTGGRTFDPHVGIRGKIGKAAEKFRDYDSECCSLILFNERFNLVDICTPRIVLGAMLGGVGFVVPYNKATGDWSGTTVQDNVFMDGGKMIHPHLKTPQNTTISAVIALERFAVGQKEMKFEIERIESEQQRRLGWEDLVALLENNRAPYERRVLRTIVYENPHARNKLPRDIFVGPYDERWGQSGDYISQVYIGDELAKLNKIEHELGLDQGGFQRQATRAARKHKS